jgi:phage gp29-like protein
MKRAARQRTAAEGGFQAEGRAVARGGRPLDPSKGGAPNTEQLLDAANIELQRRMRFNPLRTLDPERLSMALDQFEIGILREAAMLWEAMAQRDDTLITVKNHLEESVAAKDWSVLKKPGLTGKRLQEAVRHQACLEYFYDSLVATDAFDRNERGGRPRLIKHMMRAESFRYSMGHIVWTPKPGKMIEVKGSASVPVISADIEYVPLWYFENTSGTMRFLPFGGFGITGQEMDWNGEWMVTTGRGLMFAASICYTFKRLAFQDWMVYNERYGQNKVVGQTTASEDSTQGQAMTEIVRRFNSDAAICFFEREITDKLPIQLLGPSGEVTVDLFQRLVDRQDRKMTVMYRGSDLSTMSRGGKGERPVGASMQGDETDRMETACCRMIQSTCNYFLDRQVIRYCFGEGVEPLAYFGLPDMDIEDCPDIRESAGFLADRGAKVKAEQIADRLGIEIAAEGELALLSIVAAAAAADPAAGEQAETTDVRRALGVDFSANAALRIQANRLLDSIDEGLRTANRRPRVKFPESFRTAAAPGARSWMGEGRQKR